MPHIRVLRHYIHTPFLYLAGAEVLLLTICGYLGLISRYQFLPDLQDWLPIAVFFGFTIVGAMAAMGVYESRTLVIFRWFVFLFLSEDALKSRIIVRGAGRRALKIATRMRRRADYSTSLLPAVTLPRTED